MTSDSSNSDHTLKDSDDRSPFERFTALTRRLVNVPKDEMDAKRKQEKAEKRRG